jgi:hypothetical protein
MGIFDAEGSVGFGKNILMGILDAESSVGLGSARSLKPNRLTAAGNAAVNENATVC